MLRHEYPARVCNRMGTDLLRFATRAGSPSYAPEGIRDGEDMEM